MEAELIKIYGDDWAVRVSEASPMATHLESCIVVTSWTSQLVAILIACSPCICWEYDDSTVSAAYEAV